MKAIGIIGLILNIFGAILGVIAFLIEVIEIVIPGMGPIPTLASAVIVISVGSICLSLGKSD